MAKEFQELLGIRVYLELPKKEDSKLVVDHNTKEALEKELLIKMSRLKVYAVGTGVTNDKLVENCQVLVDPEALTKAKMVPVSKDKTVAMISYHDIIHIW